MGSCNSSGSALEVVWVVLVSDRAPGSREPEKSFDPRFGLEGFVDECADELVML